jgi:microcystin-dependent protein
MAQISIRQLYADAEILFASDLDAIVDDIETFLNSTKINDDNIQASGITASDKLVDASVNAAKLASDSVTTVKILDANVTREKIVSTERLPIGMIVPYAGSSTPPSGFLLCDGTAVSRTTYADLYSAIGVAFGYGNNSTTFNLPDLRGRFLRGVDGSAGVDPDKASRSAMATGGNSGNNVGSIQGSAYTNHSHTITDPGHVHDETVSTTTGGPGSDIGIGGLAGGVGQTTSNTLDVASNTTGITATNASTTGSTETRPVNAYVYYMIKY